MCDTSVALSSAWKGSCHSKTDIILVTSAGVPALLNSWLIILESRGTRLFLYSHYLTMK